MKKGPLYILGCYLLFGVLPVFWKLLEAVDSFYILAARIVWALAFMAVVLAVRHALPSAAAVFRDRREMGRLALSSVLIGVNWGSYIWAVNHHHILDASLAYYMNPILVILLGTLFFRERLSRLQWLAAAVTFTGLVVTILRYREVPWIALVISASFACYGAVKKNVRADAGTSVFVETLLLAPAALLYMLWADRQGMGAAGVLAGWRWLLLPAAGVVTTVPLLFYAKGLKETPLTLSGILMYINPTLQLLISVLLYGEEFTTTHAILFGFVWSGLALYLASMLWESRRHQKEISSCE